jgi:DNA helicase-2/ATP-dependent DNA helicase PcrA
MATGRCAEIEEERRLLYVAMTRARDALTLWVPQRFHVTQQRAWGDRHLYALRSRFIPDDLLPQFDTAHPAAAEAPGSDAGVQAGPPPFDLAARLRHDWAPSPGGGPPPKTTEPGQNAG